MDDKNLDESFREIIRQIRQTAARVEQGFAQGNAVEGFPAYRRQASAPRVDGVHVYELLQGDDATFVQRAYQHLLRRDADEEGRRNYLARLQRGESRLLLAAELLDSMEGRSQQAQATGWGVTYYPVRLHGWLKSLRMGKLSRVRNGVCKLIAKLLQQYEKKYLARHPVVLLNAFLGQKFQALQGELDNKTGDITRRIQQQDEDVGQRLKQQDDTSSERFQQMQGQAGELKEWLLNHNRDLEQLTAQAHQQAQGLLGQEDSQGKLREALASLHKELAAFNEELDEQGKRSSLLRQDALYQQYHLRQLLAEIRGEADRLAPAEADQHLQEYLDAYYIAFEDANRGSTQQIRQQLSVYLPYVQPLAALSQAQPLLDIGCGRGEWLSLLHDHGIAAYGLDINGVMVNLVRKAGLDARHVDALTHLQQLPDNSLSAVSSMHVVEHLPFPVLFNLLMEIRRVLVPGGLLLLETPNPENVLVGSHTFYHDFTHRNPVTPTALTFLARYLDFQDINILRLHPYPESAKVSGNDPLTERVNGHLCGPQDFALIASKGLAVLPVGGVLEDEARRYPAADTGGVDNAHPANG